MRKLYMVFASIFGGLALIFAIAGLINVLAPDPMSFKGVTRDFVGEPEMLQYIGGSLMGVGLICAGIVFAVISNGFINLWGQQK